MDIKGGKIRIEENKVRPSDESLRNVLIRYGINPDRIKDFIDNNIDSNRDISELKKTASNKMEYCKEQLVINEVEILRFLLEE
ncbi:MAG: hypothetical protein DI539_19530 [Flavobacterium psychrophilum]|nr:MAG: hypothetical protein DI539_19530 [Flavobacterium psychrophilum]